MSLPVIAITNQSTVLTDDEVKAVLPALQDQVSLDFKAYWDMDATLVFLPKDQTLITGWWQIVILDDPDQAGALGYHEMSAAGTPLGKIFAKLDKDNGYSWTVTLSHELLEMLGDPDIDTAKQGQDGLFYALEVCDAVESDALGYKRRGILLSDFVTPRWFNDYVGVDRYSFCRHVKKPLELAAGGYISVVKDGQWTQITAQTPTAQTPAINPGSRRFRRAMAQELWKKSER